MADFQKKQWADCNRMDGSKSDFLCYLFVYYCHRDVQVYTYTNTSGTLNTLPKLVLYHTAADKRNTTHLERDVKTNSSMRVHRTAFVSLRPN